MNAVPYTRETVQTIRVMANNRRVADEIRQELGWSKAFFDNVCNTHAISFKPDDVDLVRPIISAAKAKSVHDRTRRPPVPPELRTRAQLAADVPLDLYERFSVKANHRGITRSELLREVITDWLAGNPT